MISEHDRQVLSSLPVWRPAADIRAQRPAWGEPARVFNRDLPAIGDLDKNVELRAGLLPPCFIMGAGDDTWCLADSLALAQALVAVSSPYELHVVEGIPHGFMQMSTLDAW